MSDGTDTLLTLNLSPQAIDLLEQLADKGIYGLTKNEVAERLLNVALLEFVNTPEYIIKGPKVVENR